MANPLQKSWKDYFVLSNRQRNSLVILFCILFFEIVLLFYLHFIRPHSSTIIFTGEDSLLYTVENNQSQAGVVNYPSGVNTNNTTKPKAYSFNKFPQQNHKLAYKKPREFIIIDIATADTSELVKLPCIGPVKARIIAEYRDKLGGFNSINQLLEVWGINDSIFDIIRPHVILTDSTDLQKININLADAYTLSRHPYFSKSLSAIIVNYRKQHGLFQSIDDLKKIVLVTDQLYLKIAPYVTVK